jgi:SNF2 family DNA or RNA helicase
MLHRYQKTGAQWLAARPVALLADEMGLGKTPQAIAAADLVGAQSLLTVCPAIACPMWEHELIAWQQTGRTIQVIRSAAAPAQEGVWGDAVITSYSLLDKILPSLRRIRFDALICDEAQTLKSITANRTKAVYGCDGLMRSANAHRCPMVRMRSGSTIGSCSAVRSRTRILSNGTAGSG